MALPNWSPPHISLQPQSSFKEWLQEVTNSFTNYVQYNLTYWTEDVLPQVNTLEFGYGDDIESAAAITVSNLIHRVTGTATIENIQLPAGSIAVGPVMLWAKDGFSLGSSGNITPAQSVAAGHGVIMAYHTALQTWVGVTS